MNEKDTRSLLNSNRNVSKQKGINFYAPEYPSNFDYFTLMGISMADFNYVFELVRSKILLLKRRSSRNSLAMLIVKFRSGHYNGILFTLLNIRKIIIYSVLYSSQDFVKIFVSIHLGM